MDFLYPTFLWALITLLIPVLIHLFSFRRHTTVYFSHVDFLKNIQQESQKKSRLKNLLILLARILALASLVFMFSQPYIRVRNQRHTDPRSIIGVYIDNSFSMNSQGEEGQLLETARRKAMEIAAAYPPDTRFLIATNDLLTRHLHLFNRDQFLKEVSDIGISPMSVTLSQVRARLATASKKEEGNPILTMYYISDFQVNTTDFNNFSADSLLTDYLLPVIAGNRGNLYIDSCWMEFPAHRPGQEEQLMVRIINHSDEGYQNLPVKFYLNDTLKAPGNFNIEPGGESIIPISYINTGSGIQKGYVEITDFPIIHDNTWFLNYTVQPQLRVLAVSDGEKPQNSGVPYLRALFDGDDYVIFDKTSSGSLTVSSLNSYNTIFLLNMHSLSTGLVSELKKAAENGTNIVFFPEPGGNIESYNSFLGAFNANRISGQESSPMKISGIDWKHPVFDQVFRSKTEETQFPEIKGSFTFTRDIRIPEVPILWFRNGEKACSSQPTGQGTLLVFSFPLSPVNDLFARDMLFVPALYGLVINLLPRQEIACTIGREQQTTIPRRLVGEEGPISVIGEATGREFYPSTSTIEGSRQRISLTEHFTEAGHYLVKSGESDVAVISMNYDRSESDLTTWLPEELATEITKHNLSHTSVIENPGREFSQVFKELRHGKRLWHYFLVAALVFLLSEALIIRFWK